jgi:hypothetical protein
MVLDKITIAHALLANTTNPASRWIYQQESLCRHFQAEIFI